MVDGGFEIVDLRLQILDCGLMKGARRKAQGARKKVTAFFITTAVGASSACDKRM